MINTFMTTSEILKEFWTDYNETIKSRLFGWIHGHAKKIKQVQKLNGGDWVKLKETRTVKVNGNTYKCRVKVKMLKDGTAAFNSTTYLSTYDSQTGRRITYLLPAESDKKYLIAFDPHFFNRYNDLVLGQKSIKIDELIDEVLGRDFTFKISVDEDWRNKDTNFYVKLQDGVYGVGQCNLSENVFKVTSCVTAELLDEWKEENSDNPLEIYLKHKEGAKKKEVTIEVPREKSQKELEIEQAWKEYYGR